MTGGSEGIGIDEAADCGIVITGLEIIQSGLIGIDVARRAFFGSFQAAFSAPQMGGKFSKSSAHQGHNRYFMRRINST